MRLLIADLAKLRRRLATWLTLGLLAGLLALVFIAVGGTANRAAAQPGARAAVAILSFPAAYDVILTFILGLGGLMAVIYGAAIAGSEWTWGTLKSAIARGESRARYVLAMFAAVAIVVAVGLVIAFGVGVAAAIIGGRLAGAPAGDLADPATLQRLPQQFLRGWIGLLEEAAIGFAVATLARSQLAGIGVGIGLYFGESFASLFLPDFVKYLPFNVASAAVRTAETTAGGGGFGGNAVVSLPPDTALLAVVGWLIGAVLVASLFTERAEITG
jgi:ABC-type transport system involved in multi-copper enzyme maturation permease subunit